MTTFTRSSRKGGGKKEKGECSDLFSSFHSEQNEHYGLMGKGEKKGKSGGSICFWGGGGVFPSTWRMKIRTWSVRRKEDRKSFLL